MEVVGLVLSVVGPDRDAGRPQEGTVTLVRGLTTDRRFVQWARDAQAEEDAAARRAAIVDLRPRRLSRWRGTTSRTPWPSRLEIGSLKAGDTSVVAERLTLTFDRVEVE